jgi:hypothetical protein
LEQANSLKSMMQEEKILPSSISGNFSFIKFGG